FRQSNKLLSEIISFFDTELADKHRESGRKIRLAIEKKLSEQKAPSDFYLQFLPEDDLNISRGGGFGFGAIQSGAQFASSALTSQQNPNQSAIMTLSREITSESSLHLQFLNINPPREFLDTKWEAIRKYHLCPNLRKMMDLENMTQGFFAHQIVISGSTLQQRKEKLPEYQKLTDISGYYINIRNKQKEVGPPLVPCLIIQQSALFLEGKKEQPGMIDFGSISRFYVAINEFLQYQAYPFDFKPILSIQAYFLRNFARLDEDL
ncbi:MAG: hypothetical protein EZS28_046440, partial [Streblomastix strix]